MLTTNGVTYRPFREQARSHNGIAISRETSWQSKLLAPVSEQLWGWGDQNPTVADNR